MSDADRMLGQGYILEQLSYLNSTMMSRVRVLDASISQLPRVRTVKCELEENAKHIPLCQGSNILRG